MSSRVPGLRMRRWKRPRVMATPLPNYDAARMADEHLQRFMAVVEIDPSDVLSMRAWLFQAEVHCGTPDCDDAHPWPVSVFTN